MKVTVSPDFTSVSVLPVTKPVPSLPATAFHPIPFNVVIKSSAVTNLPFVVVAVGTPSVSVVIVAVLGVNVIVSPLAVTSNNSPSLDLTVNLIPFSWFRFCAFVSPDALFPFLPANLILLVASSWNWLPLIASLDSSEMLPFFTFVIFTGSVSSLSDTLISPSAVLLNLGPLDPPNCTVLKEGVSTVANVILPLLLCVTFRFLPAIISIVLPALMSSPSMSTLLLPFLVPPVVALAFNVKAALFTAFTTESTVAILPLSPSFTFTVPESSPVVTDSISPVFTLYLIVDTLLPLVSTTTVVPLPFAKLTVS